MASPFDEEIDRLKAVIEDKRQECDRALACFFDVTAGELAPRLEAWVKDETKRQHGAFTSLTVDKVSALKTELTEILVHSRTPYAACGIAMVFGLTVRNGNRPLSRQAYEVTTWVLPIVAVLGNVEIGEKLNDVLNNAIRNQFSTFLEKYGFTFPVSRGYKFVMNPLDWTDPMSAAMKEYSAAYKRYNDAQERLRDQLTKKGRHEAEELWNKA